MTLLIILCVIIYLCSLWSVRKYVRDEDICVSPKTFLSARDDRFYPNAEFCPHCLTNNYWYRGGGSWSPDHCPNHIESDDFILWKQMNWLQRDQAVRKFDRMWYTKYNCHYFKEN